MRAALLFFSLMTAAWPAAAQNLVITNARIIIGNGQVIERGSLVAQNGRIASVGSGAASSKRGLAGLMAIVLASWGIGVAIAAAATRAVTASMRSLYLGSGY